MSPNHQDHESWKKFEFIGGVVCGIPCQIAFTWYPGCRGARERGTGLQLEPDESEGPEDIHLFNRKGWHIPWLEEKADRANVWDEIHQDITDHVREKRAESYYEYGEYLYEQRRDRGFYDD